VSLALPFTRHSIVFGSVVLVLIARPLVDILHGVHRAVEVCSAAKDSLAKLLADAEYSSEAKRAVKQLMLLVAKA